MHSVAIYLNDTKIIKIVDKLRLELRLEFYVFIISNRREFTQ